ncbi:alpha/beta hydrolase [Microbacterium ulmi]|uniref:DUF1023 domain-containing protein n=1 Tax=Microbacterium ulmi TaxID=179095 RepID=A0A7Y2Q1M2_9MICO|nr:alpha/beta hydrolase [Microbacterium ulmi]NII69311.1 hypothetical protein [Microbacterium ulmi]NNH04075.1 hypothetical protein [Microbacterium ulmi]
MTDGVDLRSGGRVAVDTVTLRTAAGDFDRIAAELSDVQRLAGSARDILYGVAGTEDAAASAGDVFRRTLGAFGSARSFALRLRAVAAIYELSELDAQRAAAGNDPAALRALEAARRSLEDDVAAYAALDPRGAGELDAWRGGGFWAADLVWQAGAAWGADPFGMGLFAGVGSAAITAGFWGALDLSGAGRIGRGDRLTGQVKPVRLGVVATDAKAVAPASLAAATARVPHGGAGRVRVETYTMSDGSRQFAVYVSGTVSQSISGGVDPFDNESNLQLYHGEPSASYEAVLEALRASGAEPGDTVHAFGHSQGGMIASYLAIDGEFEVSTIVTAGSPVEADVGPSTLSVQLRHGDDLISALAGGGHDDAVGAPGSFIAERIADPAPGPHDLELPAHGLGEYVTTAERVDASSDPRVEGIRDVLAELAQAESVSSTLYSAVRVSASSADEG